MKTSKDQKSITSQTPASKSFFSKNGTESFFSKSDRSGKSFFSTAPIQTKLTIGSANDKYEQEADLNAEKVVQEVNNPRPTLAMQKPSENGVSKDNGALKISRKPFLGHLHTSHIQTKSIESRLNTSNGKGKPLTKAVRSNMEPAFGADFSSVKIHTDANAIQMNRELGARAFTQGSDIYFNQGEYQTSTTSGKKLLAHELTHVLQQDSKKVVRRQPIPSTTLTQQLYNQAITSIASKSGVNPRLLSILRSGRVGQRVAGVHAAATTLQATIPPQGSATTGTSVPVVQVAFDLEISPNTTQLPAGAFAAFSNDAANQTNFSGRPTATSSLTITRLLKILTKAPTGANAADTLGLALVHEGTHMLLEIDRMLDQLKSQPGISRGMTGALTSFNRYTTAAANSSRRSALVASMLAEVNRVFTPRGATATAIPAATANQVIQNVIARVLEERFAVDRHLAAFQQGATVSNAVITSSYLWQYLGEETSRTPWPRGSNAQAIETAMTLLLNDVGTQINPPATTPTSRPTTTPTTTPTPTPSPTPNGSRE